MRHALAIIAKVIAWMIFAVVFVGVVIFIGVFHLGFLEFGINYQLQKLLEKRTPLRVTIGDIKGDFFNTMIIDDVNITYDDGVTSYQLARIPRVQAAYSLLDLWRGRIDLDLLKLDSLDIVVRSDSSGRWLLPEFAGGDEGQPDKGLPSFSVERLILESCSISLIGPERTTTIDSVNLSLGVNVFDGAYAVDLRNLTGRTSFLDTRLEHAEGKVTISRDRFVFKDLLAETNRVDVFLDGFVRVGDTTMGHFDLKRGVFDMGYVGAVFGSDFRGELSFQGGVDIAGDVFSGDLDITGDFQDYSFKRLSLQAEFRDGMITADTVYGEILGGCAVAGKMTFDTRYPGGAYTFAGETRNFNLSAFTKGAVESDFNGSLRLDGAGTRSADMRINADVDLRESSLDIFYAHTLRGSLVITTDSVRLEPDFAVTYYENEFVGEGLIEFAGPVALSGGAEFRDLSRFNGKLFVEELGGRAEARYRLTGTLEDPNVSGWLYSDSLWLYEMFSRSSWYEFDIERFLTRRRGSVTAELGEIEAWEFPLDSLFARLRIDSNIVYLDSIDTHTGEASLAAAGRLDYLAEPIPVDLHRTSLEFFDRSYRGADTVRFLYDTTGIEFLQLPFTRVANSDTVRIEAVGRVGFDQSFDVRARLREVQINPWLSLLPQSPDLYGSLSCDLGISGRPDSLTFYGVASVDSLIYYDLLIGDISGVFDYRSDTLALDTFHLTSPNGYHSLKGVIPMHLDLAAEDSVVRFPGQQRLALRSDEREFDFVSFFLPQVEDLAGQFVADATVSGTPLQPQFNGRAKLSDATLKIYELEIPAESLYVALDLAGRTIVVDTALCRFPPKRRNGKTNQKFKKHEFGRATVSGSMEILGLDKIDYDLAVNGRNIPANYTLGAFTGKVDAQLRVRGVTPPTVTGSANVIAGLYEEEFLEEDAGYVLLSQFEKPDAWGINVNVDMTSNARVRNTDIDAEFKGKANTQRINGLWYFTYDLEVIRGRLFLPLHTFRLDPGGTVVNSDISVNNPDLNMTARTKIRVRQVDIIGSETQKSVQKIAAIRITGTLEEPLIDYYDDPSLSADEKVSADQLYALLAANYQLEGAQLSDVGARAAEALASS
ncbi:MAG TPA: translocation/assembly module TamB domain-containing protein, partial [candidate division Zixibacteria bacterium]|nr:translocation/assembly module TamB domain-containing protein [candidate division Zixibacteria bacterium]